VNLYISQAEHERTNRAILRGNAERAAQRGDIRPHEVERVVDISASVWKGSMGNGEATRIAVDLVREGKA
jgi:hypothetical protein